MLAVFIGLFACQAFVAAAADAGKESAGNREPVAFFKDDGFQSADPGKTNPLPHHVTIENRSLGGRFGHVVAGGVDLDRDGIPEIAISDPRYSGRFNDGGRVYFLRADSGPGLRLVHTIDGPHPDSYFGGSILGGSKTAGRYPDAWILGAQRLPGAEPRMGGVYRASVPGFGTNIDHQLLLTGKQPQASFGASLSGGADVNGDGFSDLLIGAPSWREEYSNEGAVQLYLGTARGIDPRCAWTVMGGRTNTAFGTTVLLSKDLNGDGYGDVVVGSPRQRGKFPEEGRVAVFWGSPEGPHAIPDWSFSGEAAHAGLGDALALGDLNGDGRDDLIIGAPGLGDRSRFGGKVFVFYGPLKALTSNNPDWTASGPPGSGFGSALAVMVDINGDHFPDLAVSAPYQTIQHLGQGTVVLFAGGQGGLTSSILGRFDGPHAKSRYGWSLSAAGDVDGDGLDDLLIGSPYVILGDSHSGRVDMILGSRTAFLSAVHCVAIRPGSRGEAVLASQLALAPIVVSERTGDSRIVRNVLLGVLLFGIPIAGVVVMEWRRQRRLARSAVLEERARIARDLHDNLAPDLARIAMMGPRDGAGETAVGGESYAEVARQAMNSVRELVWETHPRNDTLDAFALFLADYATRFFKATPFRLDLDIPVHVPDRFLSPTLRREMMAVVKEGLHNAVKHSRGQTVKLALRIEGAQLSLVISDDGAGFSSSGFQSTGHGLANMRLRTESMGGALDIESSAGQGTTLRIRVELKER